MKKTLTLTPSAVIEPVGNDVMVMMPGSTDILRISGPAAETLRTIVAGQPVDPSTPTVIELADQGIISTSGVSRRGLIRAGAIGAGAGIAVLAMPSVAAASSTNWIELRGFSLDNGDGTWMFELQNNLGFDAGFDSPPLLSPGIPVPPPTTDIDNVSGLSMYIGPNQPLVVPIGYSRLTPLTPGGAVFIGWDAENLDPVDPGPSAIGEFTWDIPGGKLYYRVTFRKDWSSFAPDPL